MASWQDTLNEYRARISGQNQPKEVEEIQAPVTNPEFTNLENPYSPASPELVGLLQGGGLPQNEAPMSKEVEPSEMMSVGEPASFDAPEASELDLNESTQGSIPNVESTPNVPRNDFREGLLREFREAALKREQMMEDARKRDSQVQLMNNMNKAFSGMGAAIANRSGHTNIKASPLDINSDLAKQASDDAIARQQELIQRYKILGDKESAELAQEKLKADTEYRDEMLKLQKEKLKVSSSNKTRGNLSPITGEPLTAGQKKADEDYGKRYNDFVSKGRNNAANTIEKMERLADEIASDTGIGEAGGGRIASILPDVMRSRKAIERRDNARNFANVTLKELFGGQLSDAEREAAAREYFNDALDNETNAKILRLKIKELKDNLVSQTEQAEYFREYGTLDGFKPSTRFSETQQPVTKELTGRDREAYDWAMNNPNDPRAEKILQRLGR